MAENFRQEWSGAGKIIIDQVQIQQEFSPIQQLLDTKMALHQKMQTQDLMDEFTLLLNLRNQLLQQMLLIKKVYQINKLLSMLETEWKARQLSFTMVIERLELEQLMEGLRQLQLQKLYQETLLQLKQ